MQNDYLKQATVLELLCLNDCQMYAVLLIDLYKISSFQFLYRFYCEKMSITVLNWKEKVLSNSTNAVVYNKSF